MDKQEIKSFSSYQLSEDIRKALALLGYQTPTKIQEAVIPALMAGQNVVAKAPTGSGKTAAFAIPLCEKMQWDERLPQALILEPTRELTEQVRDEVFHIGRMKRLKVPAVIGGFPIDKQIQTLRQKSHIVVGTPGRIMDHLRRDSLKLDNIKYLIIDEADLMLDMGFIDEVKEILDGIPAGCQISLFSATLKPKIQELAENYIHNQDMVQIIQATERAGEPAITQKLYKTDIEQKYQTFLNVLMNENPENCLIFCGTREMVNVLFQKLRRARIFCGMLHGDMEQKERLKTVAAFRRGGFRFLIATDVAARGIDFDGITHVVNYDFPTGKETYVHRIGRTGRNGNTGTAISLVGEGDSRMLQTIREYTGQELTIENCPDISEQAKDAFWQFQRTKVAVKAPKEAALNQGITRLAIGGGRKSKIRAGDIVGAVCSIPNVEVSDIGVIDVRDSLSYVEILNGKGDHVWKTLQEKTLKGKIRKIRKVRL